MSRHGEIWFITAREGLAKINCKVKVFSELGYGEAVWDVSWSRG